MSRQPGRLQVGAELGDDRQRPAGHVGVRAAARQLRDVRQLGQLLEHDADGRVVVLGVVAGHRADAGGTRHASAAVREADEIVHEPTTRVPS